jgi:predicted MPP superfamily phosphohydrolase
LIECDSGQQFPASRWPRSRGALEVGRHRALHIREERLETGHATCRLLYVSDIHLRGNRSEALCRQVLNAVDRCTPHAVLLGGDLVDRSSMLGSLRELVRKLREVTVVLAIGGNHDQRIGMDRVREAVEDSGGRWIHDGTARVTHDQRLIVVSGPDAAPPVDGDVRVLCAHNPRIWKTAGSDGYDLVLAGHLHGGQIVAFEYRDRLFPGAILYPYCFLSHQRGSTRLVVSRGVSDLVPIRWRCPREVVLCYV